MVDINTRASVLGLEIQDSQGTRKVPSSSTKYIALQGDFSMAPAFENLENPELKNSLGKAKPIRGLQNPTANGSHLLRHSGVEGQEPNYGPLLQAGFGAKTVNATEYNTVASSTTTAIKVDTGEGAQFERGQIYLVKDPVNGYTIGAVDSISTDDLVPAFALANAPGTGVNLGKCVLYKPAENSHPYLCLHHYMGNEGAVQALIDGRVTELSFSFTAGQIINMGYQIGGAQYLFNPPTAITTSNNHLDFDVSATEYNAEIPVGQYQDPHELAAAIGTAMTGAGGGDTYTCTYSNSTGKFTITTDGTNFSLLWATGTNSADTIRTVLGFGTGDDSAAASHTSDDAQDYSAPHTPSYDSADPQAATGMTVQIGDQSDNASIECKDCTCTLSTPKRDKDDMTATSGRSGSTINEREATITFNGYLQKNDAEWFRRYRTGDATKFLAAFGTKSGGNWVAGKCGAIFSPTATVSDLSFTDDDGIIGLSMTLTTYVNDDGQGEIYFGLV